MERFDVLVLGGGAAGCVLASRLSENPDRTVGLVEAGPDYGPYAQGRWPADILDARQLALDSHCWERDDENDRSQLRARILGGCSAHNACVVLRGARSDYDEWGPGWSYAELEPYLDRGERALRSRPLGEDELSPWAPRLSGGRGRRRDRACRQRRRRRPLEHVAVEPGYQISAAAFAMKPRSRGSVRLNAREPEAPLVIDHGFLRDERDADVLAEGFEALRELVAGEDARRYAAAELRPGAEVDAAAHVRATARGFFHPVATCALGTVVDERCRVLGFENLYVADASVIPTIPRANTHLSTIAIAERATEWI